MDEERERDPRTAKPGERVTGYPEPPGEDPGDVSDDREPHHALSNPVGEPDPTEWPDPYESRDDPKDEPHPPTGSTSTSEPHPTDDPEAGEQAEPPERDKLDD